MSQAVFPFALPRRPEPAGSRPLPRSAAAPAACRPSGGPSDPGDVLGFDHARYGLVPPSGCLWPGHPVREGWERGRRLVGRRTRAATLAVRRWLAVRLQAWQEGRPFDDHQITPQVLRALECATTCPITGASLDEEAQVVPADNARGWEAGNLILVAPAVAARWRALGWDEAQAALARAQADPQTAFEGLSLAAWRRIVCLKSLATPLPDAQVVPLPLVVLPPNRLRLVNALQELQAVLTLQLAVPGWGARARIVTQALPLTLRSEFNLFFHSLLAQALRLTPDPARRPMREALALAWEDAVVLRRWARFARRVDAALARTLVDRLAREGLPGVHVVRHEAAALAA